MNLYGFAGGDPVNYSDPLGLWPCPELCGGAGTLATAGGGAAVVEGATLTIPGVAAVAGALAPAASGAAFGLIGTALLAPAFPGDGLSMSRAIPGALVGADATVVFNKKEGKQIKAAIKSVTGQQATTSQYNCMSEFIHECKESGDGGSKNKKGDFTWDELLQIARDLFGKKP